jgi:ribosome biogenesis GTPase / thiamine phosphate phosphatase
VKGLVVGTHRRHYDVVLPDGERLACVLKGRAMRIAVGDAVSVDRDREGGVIAGIEPRRNLVYRSDAFKEKLVAANVTQIAAVVAPDIALDEELLHRWMIAAEAAQCRYVIFANKQDLPSFSQLRARLAPLDALGYPVVPLSARHAIGTARDWLEGQHTVLVGQSGMGKSTLINALVPDAHARTTEVSESLNAGRHTTTSATLYIIDERTWIVDSPGMKVFGLAHVPAEDLAAAFVEIRPFLGHCRFRNCRHAAEPGCAVMDGVARGKITPQRLALMHAILREVAGKDGVRSR